MINKNDPDFDLQLYRAQIWLDKSKKLTPENNIEVFTKFYFLWSAFNSLYNLELNKNKKEQPRIKAIIGSLDKEDAEFIINKNESFCKWLMLEAQPIVDMKYEFLKRYNPDYISKIDIRSTEEYSKEYINAKSTNKQKLESLILTIYQIRNNLTHGNKSGDERDYGLVKNSISILEDTIRILIDNLAYVKKRYFAYGSNMDKKIMDIRCPGNVLLGKAYLSDFKLDFTRKSTNPNWDYGGVADIVTSSNSEVWGLLYEISKSDLSILDNYEGCPTYYKRKKIKVLFNNEERYAVAYEVVNKKPFTPPSTKYMDLLKDAALNYDFPQEYIEFLRSIETK